MLTICTKPNNRRIQIDYNFFISCLQTSRCFSFVFQTSFALFAVPNKKVDSILTFVFDSVKFLGKKNSRLLLMFGFVKRRKTTDGRVAEPVHEMKKRRLIKESEKEKALGNETDAGKWLVSSARELKLASVQSEKPVRR